MTHVQHVPALAQLLNDRRIHLRVRSAGEGDAGEEDKKSRHDARYSRIGKPAYNVVVHGRWLWAFPAVFAFGAIAGPNAYVANGRSNSVSVIDTQSYQKLRDIAVGELPWGVVVH
jgi:YVTN family beta-propeller protein